MNIFWRAYWKCDWWLRGLRCMIIGHDISYEDRGHPFRDDAFCNRCWRGEPEDIVEEDERTLPYKLSLLEIWIEDHFGN